MRHNLTRTLLSMVPVGPWVRAVVGCSVLILLPVVRGQEMRLEVLPVAQGKVLRLDEAQAPMAEVRVTRLNFGSDMALLRWMFSVTVDWFRVAASHTRPFGVRPR